MFALVNTETVEIVQGPWTVLPPKVKFSPGDVVFNPQVGTTHENFPGLQVVNVVYDKTLPSPYHQAVEVTKTLAGDTLTVAHAYVEGPQPEVDEVKAEAQRRIYKRYPIWRQVNFMYRLNQLQQIEINGGTLTAGQAQERADINAHFKWIRDMRQKSEALEASRPYDMEDDAQWTLE